MKEHEQNGGFAAALQEIVADRLARLRGLAFRELAGMAEWHSEFVSVGSRRVKFVTYSLARSDGSRAIVVQAFPEGTGLVWRDVRAAGFRVWPDGSTREVGPPEIYEFM